MLIEQPTLRVLAIVFLTTAMFGLGFEATRREIVQALSDRRFVGRALLANLVVLPALGVAVALLAPVAREVKLGIALLALAPGAPFGIQFMRMVKGSEAVAITIVNDGLVESDETIQVTLSNPSNATLGTNTVHTYTINDNDAYPTVAFDLVSSSGAESVTPANLSVSLGLLSKLIEAALQTLEAVIVRLQGNCLVDGGLGFIYLLGLGQGYGQRVVSICVFGLEFDQLPKVGFGLVELLVLHGLVNVVRQFPQGN